MACRLRHIFKTLATSKDINFLELPLCPTHWLTVFLKPIIIKTKISRRICRCLLITASSDLFFPFIHLSFLFSLLILSPYFLKAKQLYHTHTNNLMSISTFPQILKYYFLCFGLEFVSSPK